MMVLNRKKTEKIFIISFLLLITLPVIGIFFQPDERKFKLIELRTVNKFPQISIKKESFDGFEKWFGDRFLFRWELTESWSRLNYTMGVSSRPDKVVIGKDGWLFLTSGVNWHQGINTPSDHELDKKVLFFKQTSEYLKLKKIPFIVVICPDKNAVYPEVLPSWVRKNTRDTTILFKEGLEKSGVKVLDLTDVVQKAKEEYLVFYHGDSHWNNLGAYFGYLKVAGELNKNQNIDIKILSPETISIDLTAKVEERNDLFRMLQLNDKVILKHGEVRSKSFADLVSIRQGVKEKWKSPMQQVPSGYVMIDPLVILNEVVNNDTRILFLRDSFSEAMSPYFNQSVRETIHLHYSSGINNNHKYSVGSLVNKYEPNVVIFQIVEREIKNDLPSFFLRADKIDRTLDLYNSNNVIKYNLDSFQDENDRISLNGLAFIPGISAADCREYIVFKSKENYFIFEPRRTLRNDISQYFNNTEKQDLAGFRAEIFKADLPKGTYDIGIYIEDDHGNRGFQIIKNEIVL